MYNFDWITPFVSLTRCASGKWRPISLYGHKGSHWAKILKRRGIRCKLGATVKGGTVLQVPRNDVVRARGILEEEGAILA